MKMNTKWIFFVGILLFWLYLYSLLPTKVIAEDDPMNVLIYQLNGLATEGGKMDFHHCEKLIHKIEENPYAASDRLVRELSSPNLSTEQMAVYLWAIGFTRDPNAVDNLIDISEKAINEMTELNACKALAKIGSITAGEYLLSKIKKSSTSESLIALNVDDKKYEMLNLVSEMQYVPAIPEVGILLEKDYKIYYWQPIFCFGKIGNKAIPYLLEKINDPNANIRLNTISILGGTLLATEAREPLQIQYWIEKNKEVKGLILSVLERLIYNFNDMKKFFEKVVECEKDNELVMFAKESLESLDTYKKIIADFISTKKGNRELFKEEYMRLYESFATEGAIGSLGILSIYEDEPLLNKLRERILQRNSDECLYDCDELNRIIMMNRFMVSNNGVNLMPPQ